MKAMTRMIDEHGMEYQCLIFICPGCTEMLGGSGLHMLPVNTNVKTPAWTWDGNLEAPTLDPSILTHGRHETNDRCHSFLRAGVFEYLEDCTHTLAGQHVPMPDLPAWVIEE
jgi:hypothetical protein